MFDIDTGQVSVLSVDDSVSVWNPERWHAATELGLLGQCLSDNRGFKAIYIGGRAIWSF